MSLLLRWTLVLQCLLYVSCLAAVPPLPSRRSIIKVVSTNKNGGAARIFQFDNHHQYDDDGNSPLKSSSGGNNNNNNNKNNIHTNLIQVIRSGLRSMFLPSGYPTKVPKFYLRYAIWSWIQDLTTQLRGVLATQRVLEGVGVGKEGATALAAMLNFLVRDGFGMAATLLFTASAASKFQSDAKRWRLFADIMVDIGITLDVASVQVPHALFLPMICIGNMCKAMCGVAGGAVGGTINLYWAEGTDISDISAKFGAQQTVTASLGLIFAALLARSISNVNQTKVWVIYSALTVLHIFANVRCMRLIAFRTFNASRLRMVFHEFWKQYQSGKPSAIEVPTPREIALREPLFFASLRRSAKTAAAIQFGVPFNNVMSDENYAIFQGWTQQVDILKQLRRPYWLSVSDCAGKLWGRRQLIQVALNANATPAEINQAYFAALVASEQPPKQIPGSQDDLESLSSWAAFCQACELAGWDLNRTNIASQGFEVTVSDSWQ